MEFAEFKILFQENFSRITKDVSRLFQVEFDKDEFWELYLNSFPSGTNNVFRERREFDCSCCRSFLKNFGNVVILDNNNLRTIWDFDVPDTKYQTVIDVLDGYIKQKAVDNVFLSKVANIGTDKNIELMNNGDALTWHHFYVELPRRFVISGNRSIGDVHGKFKTSKEVFKRSLDELTQDSIETVLELINSNTLYKGQEWKQILNQFLKLMKEYDTLDNDHEKNNYAWLKSTQVGEVVSHIRNHSIGILLVNISGGMNLDLAVKKYESIVAPQNYKRPKPIFTKKMIEQAQATVEELGYMNSLQRRYATIDDITVNNILFLNKDVAKKLLSENVFDEMEKDVVVNPKKFKKIEEISISDFIKNVLPTTHEIDILFENKHKGNLVSLISPEIKESNNMMKWSNSFSWAYSGNITDSLMKDRVKTAGGKIDGDLRFTIQWNDIEHDTNDLDAHCVEPKGYEIYFSNKCKYSPTKGILDVDIINPVNGIPSVENITWASHSTMIDGEYEFFVHAYSGNNRNGFRAEVEFDGNIHSFNYDKPIQNGDTIMVATVTLKDGVFTIKNHMPSNASSQKYWGIKTNQFIPVSVFMYSPNYWDEQHGIGHKHYLFMLKDCINDESPNGFYNEFLKNELHEHKKVFEALGNKMKVNPSDNQLSGIGFSETRRNELTVRVTGKIKRILKIKF